VREVSLSLSKQRTLTGRETSRLIEQHLVPKRPPIEPPRVTHPQRTSTARGGKRKVYEELRSGIEAMGGTMVFDRSGSTHGTWVVRLKGKSAYFDSNGRGFPDLDRLYVPRVSHPRHYTDYSNELVPGALEKLIRMLS